MRRPGRFRATPPLLPPLAGAALLAASISLVVPGAAAPPPAPSPAAAVRREPLPGPPGPALFLAQAQFDNRPGPDGRSIPTPGAAKLTIYKPSGGSLLATVLEDPDSNVFHKAIPWEGGLLTIGATKAMLKTWRFTGGKWVAETRWNPTFGGRFDRLRDAEVGDVDGDGKPEVVVVTHDQGVVAILHPSEGWRVEEIDRQPDTFVHEVEIGDVDGDGRPEIFTTPSRPNKLDAEQPGEVRMYARDKDGRWQRSVVDAPGDTHAKEILAADTDGDGRAELFIVWEGAIGKDGQVVRPVTIRQYRRAGGSWDSSIVATVPDRQMRSIAAGDVNGDGRIDLVAGGLGSGLWLFERTDGNWTSQQLDASSSGFEHPVAIADLDGNGKPEIWVAAEDQHELRAWRWLDRAWSKETIGRLTPGDITWNITSGRL